MVADSPTGGVRETALSFVEAAFAVLREQNVLPAPRSHAFLEVGRDYFGPDLMPLLEYVSFEKTLETTYPERFADPLKRRNPEFASTYMFRFLEAAIARCTFRQDYATSGSAVADSIDELTSVLASRKYEAICCRLVSHVTTASPMDVAFGDFELIPERKEFGHLFSEIASRIPGAESAFNGQDPRPYDPPHALIVARVASDRPDPHEVVKELSSRIERLLFLIRLATASTVQSCYEVQGLSTLVSRMTPIGVTFRKGMLDSLVRRTARLSESDVEPLEKLGGLVDAADVKRTGMLVTSFDAAVAKFNRSHVPNTAFEHVVELATALEGSLAGGEGDNEGLTLRIRSRAAALLATDEDPAQRLFDDVGGLYNLRSKLVHGGQLKESDLRKLVDRISTVPPGAPFGIAIAHAVDRMRDLVRRSILARLFLASDPDPVWPFTNATSIDAMLADDVTRQEWRSRWRARLVGLGLAQAADRPRAAVEFVSREDR